MPAAIQALRLARSKLESSLEEYAQASLMLANWSGSSPATSLRDMSSDVKNELRAFTSLKEKTMQVEATLAKVRNSLLSVVPINMLPDEVLLRIFHWTMKAHSSIFQSLVDEGSLPVNTTAISQVCTRWRRICLSSKSLWSHIDITIRGKVVSLGKQFATRSRDQPLSIRVVEPLDRWANIPHFEYDDLITTVGSRMESLEFAWVPPPPHIEFSPIWFDILQYCLFCATKKLVRLTLSCRRVYIHPAQYPTSTGHWFLVVDNGGKPGPTASDTGLTMVMDKVSERHYEDVLSKVRFLHLDRVYPMWTSKAYHGLVELRLDGPPRATAIITAGQIAGILAASPGLRVLNLGIEIIPTIYSLSPVLLEELEVFLLQSLSPASQQTILELISPGSKPLQMSTTHGDGRSELPDPDEDEFSKFFRRSNIVQLHVHSPTYVLPERLLELLPNIQTLIFRGVFMIDDDIRGGVSCPRLSALHFIACTMRLDSLIWLISGESVREVTIWECRIMDDYLGERPVEEFKSRLLEVCPVIRFLGVFDSSHNFKVEGWGVDIQTRLNNARILNYAVD